MNPSKRLNRRRIDNKPEPRTIEQVFVLTLDAEACVLLRGKYWDGLYKLLPAAPDGSRPPTPLILGGDFPDDDEGKRIRMREHIEWAERYGVLDRVHHYILRFLETVPKDKQ
jgi:hypothetical protein